jgi:hypothetical protein
VIKAMIQWAACTLAGRTMRYFPFVERIKHPTRIDVRIDVPASMRQLWVQYKDKSVADLYSAMRNYATVESLTVTTDKPASIIG